MKALKNLALVSLLGASLVGFARLGSAQVLVYDNSAHDLLTRLTLTNGAWAGDEIILGGSLRTFYSFDFEYWGTNFSGGEQAQVRFYRNDGPLFNGYPTPGTIMYDSGLFPITETVRATLNFSQADVGAITLPNDFTWSVQFSGLTGSARAGVDIYSPPVVGNNFSDYWFNGGAGWVLLASTNGLAMDFAARFQAVPEPSAFAFLALGGLVGLFVLRFRKG